MSSMRERWKIQDELDEKYIFAKAITSGEMTMAEAEAMFKVADPEKWPGFCAFLEEYRKDKEPVSK